MSERFLNVDRETPMLLPPDLRDWVEDDDLANFILEAVNGVDLTLARTNAHGTGSAQHPPAMMLAVLIYCYATGTFSSRQIEALTYRHVSVRYLAANLHPDHDTICKFRRENEALIKASMRSVLRLAATVGLGRVGTFCVDGTKLLADAAKRRTFNEEGLKAEQQRLDLEIAQLLAKAEKADQEPVEDGTRLPDALRNRQRLRAQVLAAQALLREQVAERYAEREAERAAWKKEPMGDCPRARRQEPGEHDRINLTDPESGLLPDAHGRYVQGYNAQLAVSAEPQALILAAAVCVEPNDRQQLAPMVRATVAQSAVKLERAVLDTGYDHPRHYAAAEKELGLEIICPPQPPPPAKTPASAQTAAPGETEPPLVESTTRGGKRVKASRRASQEVRERMKAKARSPEGRRWLRVRRTTVEPTFGLIKSVLGFRRFHLRGLAKANVEWQLVALAFNCRRVSPVYAQKGALPN